MEVDIDKRLQRLESRWSKVAIARLCGYLSCAQYGLTELELLELLMPTSQSAAEPLRLQQGNFNFSTFCRVRRDMGKFRSALWLRRTFNDRLLSQVLSCGRAFSVGN